MNCRNCDSLAELQFLDLGSSPLANGYLSADALRRPEVYHPLRVVVCESCWLVQTDSELAATDIFTPDYAYFSSTSSSWLSHARTYAERCVAEFGLSGESLVVEAASNDGYLLKNFVEFGVPCLGIEPTASTAAAARAIGIPTVERFLGVELAGEIRLKHGASDLVIANNVLAHVPEPRDFLDGIRILLGDEGVATFEFPHLMRLVAERQFDTIYHEHYSYFSLTSVVDLLSRSGLRVFRVEELPTHGGSLRVFCSPSQSGRWVLDDSVNALRMRETAAGVTTRDYYAGFQREALSVKYEFLSFLLDAARQGKKVVGYGAAAKGNTLLNFAGVRPDLIEFVADRNPAKQGKFLPGSRIPVVAESELLQSKPDFVVILPWNLSEEIQGQLEEVRSWGTRFVRAVPTLQVM